MRFGLWLFWGRKCDSIGADRSPKLKSNPRAEFPDAASPGKAIVGGFLDTVARDAVDLHRGPIRARLRSFALAANFILNMVRFFGKLGGGGLLPFALDVLRLQMRIGLSIDDNIPFA